MFVYASVFTHVVVMTYIYIVYVNFVNLYNVYTIVKSVNPIVARLYQTLKKELPNPKQNTGDHNRLRVSASPIRNTPGVVTV